MKIKKNFWRDGKALWIQIIAFAVAVMLNSVCCYQMCIRDSPCTEPETSKKGIYEITDNYYKFWYRFLFTNQNYYSMLGLELSCEETSVYSI